ncbi:GIY-YIG nuclease family protein [Aquimarina macrocephali]|uniref:GIY-YIG nuclease family protein n=1 Tax=Aquimarina macrocephali TaxID=666563 RepID=UPI003F669CAC
MKQYYVYIILCSDNLTYTGITNTIARKLKEHQKTSKTAYIYPKTKTRFLDRLTLTTI